MPEQSHIASFVIDKNWRHTTWPATDEQASKLVCMPTVEHTQLQIGASSDTRWPCVNLRMILLSEKSQTPECPRPDSTDTEI